MATKVITVFTCDVCGASAEPETMTPTPKKMVLPEEWVAIIGDSNRKKVLNLQCCPDCVSAINAVIDVRRDIAAEGNDQ